MRRRALRGAVLAAAAMVAVVAVGGCTGSAGGAGGGRIDAAGPAAGAQGRAAQRGSGTVEGLAPAKIRIAQITVVIKYGDSVADRADAATTIAIRAGGEVDADDRSAGAQPSATLVVRVPPTQLRRVLDAFGRLGRERSRQLSTQDVSAKVADVTARVASARAAIARLRQLYARAVKVADVIAIESELATRESDLESLEAQQRALARQTSTAVVTLSLRSGPAPAAAQRHRTGFIGGLRNGWDAFTATISALATALGAVLPFAVLLVLLGAAARLLWVQLRSRMH
jgi:hypothetical protein